MRADDRAPAGSHGAAGPRTGPTLEFNQPPALDPRPAASAAAMPSGPGAVAGIASRRPALVDHRAASGH